MTDYAPVCQACGSPDEPEVHHLDPVSWKPERELDPDNLITLCRRCHLLLGHLNDWESFNPWCEMDVATWRSKIRLRPRKGPEVDVGLRNFLGY